MTNRFRLLPVLGPALVLVVAGCIADGPPQLQPEAFRFEGRDYHVAGLPVIVVPTEALTPIGAAESFEWAKALADPTVYAADGVEPEVVVFAKVTAAGGTSVIDPFVSGVGAGGEPLYPDGICQYVPLGGMPAGLSVRCSPPFAVEALGTRYSDSAATFAIGPADLADLGPFEVVYGQRPPELGTVAKRITGVPPDTAIALTLGDHVLVYVREGLFEERTKEGGEEGRPILPAALCDRLVDATQAPPWCGDPG